MIELQQKDYINIIRCKNCRSIFSISNSEYKEFCDNNKGLICPNCNSKIIQHFSFICKDEYSLRRRWRYSNE